LLLAAVVDFLYHRLPNWLNVIILGGGILGHSFRNGFSGAGWSIAGAAVGFIFLLFPYIKGWTSGGDLKLMTAIGAWFGPRYTCYVFGVSTVAGGGIALFYWLRAPSEQRRKITENLKATILLRAPLFDPPSEHVRVPYGLALSLGSIVTLLFHFQELLKH